MTSLPFGLRDVKLYPLTGDTPGTAVDLPNSRTLSFSEAEDFEELRGDDGVVAVRGLGPTVDWDLEAGGVNLPAIKTMYGGTVTTTGTGGTLVDTYTKKGTDARPYFQAKGQAISDSGGDFVVTLRKCRATGELSGELADGSFWLTGASGRAIAIADGTVYIFEERATSAALV